MTERSRSHIAKNRLRLRSASKIKYDTIYLRNHSHSIGLFIGV
ncbi:hypothetical protein SAMN06265377_3086 [Flagellimonas pacifica]|uniref:Uncharacterized protein n=1 Tax=Flagellimonas pacifica TaxID=1247520 RepID=A0A285MVN2_9FLAO|nr:hypothetical protein SAMN06265377_3086 [Allomuricauda parva]